MATHIESGSGTNFIPQLWAGTILRTLENNLVGNKICTTDYTGEIKKAGDAVHFNGLNDPDVKEYSGSNIVYESLSDIRRTLNINKQDYFAFDVDDIVAAQANVELRNSQANRAAYKLKDACDKYILKLAYDLSTASSTDAPTGSQLKKDQDAINANKITASVTSKNVLSSIGQMAQKLDEANVTNESKFIVISPAMKLKLILAGVKFQIANGIKGGSGLEFTNDLGFDMYVSNNLHTASGATWCIGGSKNAIAFADQITETEMITRESKFVKSVRGLHVYGAKIIRPEELTIGVFTAAAETEI